MGRASLLGGCTPRRRENSVGGAVPFPRLLP